MLSNHCVLKQQHVDCKIADALLKKGTKQHADGWDTESRAWAHAAQALGHFLTCCTTLVSVLTLLQHAPTLPDVLQERVAHVLQDSSERPDTLVWLTKLFYERSSLLRQKFLPIGCLGNV